VRRRWEGGGEGKEGVKGGREKGEREGWRGRKGGQEGHQELIVRRGRAEEGWALYPFNWEARTDGE
jgi:hypothetical protein